MGKSFFFFFFGKTTRGLQAVVPAQFRQGCPSDVPLRFGTGHGERGEKGVMEGEREDRKKRSEQDALSPHYFSSLATY